MAARFSVGQRVRLSEKGFASWRSLIEDITEHADVVFVIDGILADGTVYSGDFHIERGSRSVIDSGWLVQEDEIEVIEHDA